jgi:hypothetical protein
VLLELCLGQHADLQQFTELGRRGDLIAHAGL